MIHSDKDCFSPDDHYDVVIVGAGPGGLTLACFLSTAGMKVLLADAREGLEPFGRGELIQPLGLGILAELGLLQPILSGEHFRYDRFHFLGMDSEPLMTTSYAGVGLSYPWALSIEPYLQDRLMWNRLSESPCVTLCPGVRYLSHEDSLDGVHVKLQGVDGIRWVHGRVIVGDDGRDSRVRKQMNLPGRISEYKDSYVSWSFELPEDVPSDSPAGDPSARYYLGPGEIFFLFSTSPRKRFFLYMVKNRDLGGMLLRGDKEFLASIDRCVSGLGAVLQTCGFPGVASLREWVIKKVDLDKWTKGNGIVIGDAAHATNPHVAQGRNQAMEDGRLLSGYLVGALTGDCGSLSDALGSFEKRRIPRMKKLHALADEMCMVWNSANPFIVWGRTRVFRGIAMIPSLNGKVVKTISGEDFIALSHLDRLRAFLKGLLN